MDEIHCDVCGVSAAERELTMTSSKNGEESTIYCSLCEGLVESGLIRPETVDGELRFRQWHIGQWTPGRLLPKAPR